MRRFTLEVAVGVFVILGLLALAYLSIELGQVQLGGRDTYALTAVFPTVAGLRSGSSVELAGVRIGWVQDVRLVDYSATVTIRVQNWVRLQEDAIASIKTRGLIGEKYVSISPGGAEQFLVAGGRLREVEPPMDVESLIGRFIQGKL